MRLRSVGAPRSFAALIFVFVGCTNGSQSLPSGNPALHEIRAGRFLHDSPHRSSLTDHVIHSFGAQGDGWFPQTSLLSVNGMLYGTTYGGGNGGYYGTVFEISRKNKEVILHSFTYTPDGAFPEGKLISVNGTLYGTTYAGGANRVGTVYSITPSGAFTVLHSFSTSGDDAHGPESGLTDVGGTLYGTTQFGGYYGYGTVYRITASGSESVLHSFGYSDGIYPTAGLIKAGHTLYGTTYRGGNLQACSGGCGTVFSITRSGKFKVLYKFRGPPDGQAPDADLSYVNGTIYGTTLVGGSSQNCYAGCGTVFSIDGSSAEKVLHSFTGPPDAQGPTANLLDVNGTLYGTSVNGGNSTNCKRGCGTIFSISTSGSEAVVYSFTGSTPTNPDGAHPAAGLIEHKGVLFGTTTNGGAYEGCAGNSFYCGTAFSISP